jgi:hypothetical protein
MYTRMDGVPAVGANEVSTGTTAPGLDQARLLVVQRGDERALTTIARVDS